MNIEKTISEQAVSDILTPMLACQDRIVTEDVAPLFDQATGLDTPPASGSVTTTIEESRSVIIAIIRKAWTATLTMLGGASVISYIAAAYTYLRNRLQGNETYGIPDRRSEISASSPLAANLALLNDRKIGGADCQDGVSLVRLLCDTTAASDVTELVDDNVWGEYLRDSQSDITSKFPNLDKLTFGARIIRINSKYIVLFNKNLSYLYFPNLEEFYGAMTTTSFNGSITNSSAITKLEMPELKRIDVQYSELGPISRQFAVQVARGCTSLREVLMPSLTYMTPNMGTGYENYLFTACPNIEKMVLGKLTALNPWITQYALNTPMEKLIHIEFGEGVAISLNLAYWNPTNAIDASRTDLIEEGSTAQNNLQQFLQNFRSFIVLRLANRKSTTALTLTLSANVYNAVTGANSGWASQHTLAELGITDNDLTDLETELGITSATIYATWLDTYTGANGIHWNVNKAS